jgi:hypothetical protein
VEIRPDPVYDFLEMVDCGQHHQDRLHEDAILPLPPSTQLWRGDVWKRRAGAYRPDRKE